MTYNMLPTSGEQLVDYLLAREEEGMGATVPLSVGKGVAWFERLGGFDPDTWMSSSPLVETVVRDLLRKLEEGAPPRKRAPRMLSAFIPALEKIVVSRSKSAHLRAGAWVKLLKIWSSLRFDDVAHMRREAIQSYDGKLSGLMRRTKTTGGGKRVKELPFHVSENAWVEHEGWLKAGQEALGRAVGGSYQLLVPAGCSRGAAVGDYVMSYQEAVAWTTEVMQEMKDPGGNRLIPHGWERFWTEHSERATLSSGLAAIGVQKPDRDLLGRWKPEGSDQYVRTYNAAVSRMQAMYAEHVRLGKGYTAYDEGAVLEELKAWLCEKWLVDSKEANAAVDAWKERLKPWETFAEMLEKKAPGSVEKPAPSPAQSGTEADSSSSSESSEDDRDQEQKKRKVDRLESERAEGYLVVYNRIDRGKLHRSGKFGCWMAKQRRFKKATEFEVCPGEDQYSSRCRLCWQELKAVASSSDSEDEITECAEGAGALQAADEWEAGQYRHRKLSLHPEPEEQGRRQVVMYRMTCGTTDAVATGKGLQLYLQRGVWSSHISVVVIWGRTPGRV